MDTNTTHTWQIERVEPETHNVTNLYLKGAAGQPVYLAGQYLTIKLPEQSPAEGKSYSISSAPHEALVRVSIKHMGRFSTALSGLQPGDTLATSLPYGFFYPEPNDTTPLTFIAAGIGIAPCLSIIKDLAQKQDPRPIRLFYSNQTEADIAFKAELEAAAGQNSRLLVHHFITRATPTEPTHLAGRLTPTRLQDLHPTLTESDIFLCGSMHFTRDLWQALRAHGVSQQQIYTEGFF